MTRTQLDRFDQFEQLMRRTATYPNCHLCGAPTAGVGAVTRISSDGLRELVGLSLCMECLQLGKNPSTRGLFDAIVTEYLDADEQTHADAQPS